MQRDKERHCCVICDDIISTENDSEEHVLTEAIGGRLTVKGFICRRCNNRAGHTWDAQLASQLHPLSLIFGVARQRGSTPSLAITTTAGEQLVQNADGPFSLTKPSFSEEATPDGVTIKIVARSMEEAERMLAGVKRKYPSVQVDRILSDAQRVTTYPKGLVQHRLELGGAISGRSIVKTALAMAHYAGVPTGGCHDALNYLRNSEASPCFGFYQATDLVVDRPTEVPIHCVSVEASPGGCLVLGYVEYFGIHRVVVCLGRQYAGDRLQRTYALDPRTGAELDLSVRLGFTTMEIEEILDYKLMPDSAIHGALANVMPTAIKKQFDAERDRVLNEAIRVAFENCGATPGELLTEDHINILSRIVAEKIAPFVHHNLARHSPIPPAEEKDEDALAPQTARDAPK